MKLLILGTGICVSNLPNAGYSRNPPGFVLSLTGMGGTPEMLMLECAELVRQRLEKHGISIMDVKNIFISHPHSDHCALTHYLQSLSVTPDWDPRYSDVKTMKLNVYCGPVFKEKFPAALDFFSPNLQGKMFGNIDVKFMTQGVCKIGEYFLQTLPVHHSQGKIEALGMRLEHLDGIFAYSGDTAQCENLVWLAHNADIFLCEISSRIGDFVSAAKYGHMTPLQAGEMALKAEVRKLVLFHFSGQDSAAEIVADCRKSGFEGEIIVPNDNDLIEQ